MQNFIDQPVTHCRPKRLRFGVIAESDWEIGPIYSDIIEVFVEWLDGQKLG